jgi:hypothetical protein
MDERSSPAGTPSRHLFTRPPSSQYDGRAIYDARQGREAEVYIAATPTHTQLHRSVGRLAPGFPSDGFASALPPHGKVPRHSPIWILGGRVPAR